MKMSIVAAWWNHPNVWMVMKIGVALLANLRVIMEKNMMLFVDA